MQKHSFVLIIVDKRFFYRKEKEENARK